jgi:NitT/TauT family transport system permease protein
MAPFFQQVSRRLYEALPVLLVFIASLVAWEIAIVAFGIKEFLVPAPSKVVLQLFNRNMSWPYHFWVTAWETVAGFLVAVVFGITVAYLIVHYRRLNQILYPYILLAQIVPKVAIAPLFFIWFGFGEVPKVLVAFLVAFFPIIIDTVVGLHAADPDMLDFMRTLGASPYKTFMKVKLPAALPHIFGGFKVAITLAVIGAVIGEFVGAESGLGYMIIRAQSHFRTDQVFASLFLLSVLGMLLFLVFVLLERLTIPWYAKMKRLR